MINPMDWNEVKYEFNPPQLSEGFGTGAHHMGPSLFPNIRAKASHGNDEVS